MKNIHIIPTDKPSRLYKHNELGFKLLAPIPHEIGQFNGANQNIYITSDEEIKEGDKYFYIIANDRDKTWINRLEKVVECKIDPKHGKVLILSSGFLYVDEGKKIILTTDTKLIEDGVQSIDDRFLEWFVKNPSCEEVEVGYGWIRLTETDNEGYWVSIPDKQFEMQQEEPKQIKCYCGHTDYCDCGPLEEPKQETLEEAKFVTVKIESATGEDLGKVSYIPLPNVDYVPKEETLEEAAERYTINETDSTIKLISKYSFKDGAKWQQERMYSEEEVIAIVEKSRETGLTAEYLLLTEQFKKK
jgi:hypothetical protein